MQKYRLPSKTVGAVTFFSEDNSLKITTYADGVSPRKIPINLALTVNRAPCTELYQGDV